VSLAAAFIFELLPDPSAWISSLLLPNSWIAILYTGIFSCAVGYTLQAVGQRSLNPALASLIMSLESVFSTIFGWLILHQVMTGRELFGCVLIFTAVILAQLPPIHFFKFAGKNE
jgi:drug/metabolite transporter (DMT)-like permease